MSTLTELAKRLRGWKPKGRITSMGDAVAQVTMDLPPFLDAADCLEAIDKAWTDYHGGRVMLTEGREYHALRAAIEGTEP